ncbi:MAG: gliding motility-associated C-terminal domain-containing protein [Bacteroidota bacterium]|nr:gliding motility-associated C-terminal domain-containing protein [Bacteroidota bacterium]
MKKLGIFLFFITCTILQTYAQKLVGGEVYGGKGVQNATHNFFDNIGNRFQVITYNNYFTADSNGYLITIPSIEGRLTNAVIKYDSNGRFLYCFRISESSWQDIDIKFDSQNNLYVLCGFFQIDSLLLYDKSAQLYKNVKALYTKKPNENRATTAFALIKITSEGNFLWVNTIYKETIPSLGNNLTSRSTILVNNNNGVETIKVFFVNTRYQTAFYDTISHLNNVGIKNSFLINSQNVILNFTLNGQFLSAKEPFKNRLQFDQKDSVRFDYRYTKEIKLVTDGIHNFAYLNLHLSKADTFNGHVLIPIPNGNVYLLAKINENDSLIWIKPLYKEKEPSGFANGVFYDFNIDILEDNLIFNLIFNRSIYYSLFKASLNGIQNSLSYKFKLDYNGDIVFTDSFNFGTNLYRHSFSNITRKHISLGEILGSDPRFKNHIPNYLNNKIFKGILEIDDSSNEVSTIIPLISNIQNTSSTIYANYNDLLGGMVDSKGKVFVSGFFFDSIILPCRHLYATLNDTSQFGFKNSDGFTVYYEPIRQFDLNLCTPFTAPSGKYIWDSSGVYLDTIPNSLGCDSIIKFNLKINASLIKIDSTVKYELTSPSGRFVWDSTAFYRDTLINRFGCDSIIIFNLKVLSNKSMLDTFNCQPIKYLSKNLLINQSGTYYDTLPNSLGGDSLFTIRFVLGSSQSNMDTTYCNEIVSPSGKYVWRSSGIYLDTLVNSVFCDSIITINYTRTANRDTLSYALCDSLLLPSGKSYVWVSGNYLDTLTTINGCDSILQINYTNLTSFSQFNVSICDSIISPSGKNVYSASGIFLDTIPNRNGCDSIIRLNIFKSNRSLTITKSNDIDCNTPYTELDAQADGLFNFIWSPVEGINNPNEMRVIANPKLDITYVLTANDTLGCKYSDSVFVKVNLTDSLGFFPNVFTPNDDGLNDCLPLNSLTDFKGLNFLVYNRWGGLVFETSNPKDCWQGLNKNGDKLTEGVYYFILNGTTNCSKQISLHGTITIIR